MLYTDAAELLSVAADDHRTNIGVEHETHAAHRCPHRRPVDHTVGDDEPLVLECVGEERCGAAHVEHEHARLSHCRLQLGFGAGDAHTLQKRLSDSLLGVGGHLLGVVRHHAIQ